MEFLEEMLKGGKRTMTTPNLCREESVEFRLERDEHLLTGNSGLDRRMRGGAVKAKGGKRKNLN